MSKISVATIKHQYELYLKRYITLTKRIMATKDQRKKADIQARLSILADKITLTETRALTLGVDLSAVYFDMTALAY